MTIYATCGYCHESVPLGRAHLCTPPRSITEAFAHDDPDCPACHGTGTVCEDHQDQPWWPDESKETHCGAAGAPCPIFMAMHS